MSTPPQPVAAAGALVGVGTAFGTFGELLQGVLPEPDGDFLVTMPIARWSTATFHGTVHSTRLEVWPAHKSKARRLARLILHDSASPVTGGSLVLESELPEGKGLASSSADLVATARAVAGATGVELPAERIEAYLRRIEPTDGVLHSGVVAYHHRAVRLRAVLGPLPPVSIVGVDEGGTIDTIMFNKVPKPFSARDRQEYTELLDRLAGAILRRDLREVGEVATRSAVKNQILRPKRFLDALRRICREADALGLVCAHSGTTLGIMLDRGEPAYPEKVAAVVRACHDVAGNATIHHGLTFDGQPVT